jgi:hypothetical protein
LRSPERGRSARPTTVGALILSGGALWIDGGRLNLNDPSIEGVSDALIIEPPQLERLPRLHEAPSRAVIDEECQFRVIF